jgi:GTP cyclohydrolase I
MNHSKIEAGVRLLLEGLDCDVKDRNYAETPERVARAYEEIFTPKDTEYATFSEQYTDFILLRGHVLWSLCPHHLLPVRLRVSVAYIPNGEVLGLSKLARVLHDCNPGPVLQEAFTREVADRIDTIANGNYGVAVLVEGNHGCMQMRGIKSGGDIVTYRLTRSFLDKSHIQDRFFQLIGNGHK